MGPCFYYRRGWPPQQGITLAPETGTTMTAWTDFRNGLGLGLGRTSVVGRDYDGRHRLVLRNMEIQGRVRVPEELP